MSIMQLKCSLLKGYTLLFVKGVYLSVRDVTLSRPLEFFKCNYNSYDGYFFFVVKKVVLPYIINV